METTVYKHFNGAWFFIMAFYMRLGLYHQAVYSFRKKHLLDQQGVWDFGWLDGQSHMGDYGWLDGRCPEAITSIDAVFKCSCSWFFIWCDRGSTFVAVMSQFVAILVVPFAS